MQLAQDSMRVANIGLLPFSLSIANAKLEGSTAKGRNETGLQIRSALPNVMMGQSGGFVPGPSLCAKPVQKGRPAKARARLENCFLSCTGRPAKAIHSLEKQKINSSSFLRDNPIYSMNFT